MEERDIIICLKKRKEKKNNSKKIYLEANRSQFSDQKDIFLIIHIMYAMIYLCTIKYMSSRLV